MYFLEGLAVGVGFGAVGKTKSATFESARQVTLILQFCCRRIIYTKELLLIIIIIVCLAYYTIIYCFLLTP